MTEFHYHALTPQGQETTGIEIADNKQQLARKLQVKRLILLKAKPVASKKISFKLSLRLVSELNDLVSGGIVLERALQILAEGDRNDPFVQLCHKIHQGLKDGLSLSQAIDRCGIFDPLLLPLIRAGEASGKLSSTLTTLENYYQERKQLYQEITTSLAYPVILVLASVISMVALTLYVIPTFKDIFEDDIEQLPLGTQICFTVSDWVAANGLMMFVVLCVVSISIVAMIHFLPGLRVKWHYLQLKIPLVGRLISQNEAGKIFSVLSILLNSGIPLLQALTICQDVIRNQAQYEGMTRCIQQIKQGGSIAANLHFIPFLPLIAERLVLAGDESGNLPQSCDKAANIIQRDLKHQLKALVTMIEPMVILFMGGVIGFVVISMLMAIFSMSDLV